MSQAPQNRELTERFIQFYRNYYREKIGELAQQYPKEKRSLYIDYDDLYTFDSELADDYVTKPGQYQEYAEEALRLFDLPADVKLGQAHVRMQNLPDTIDIRNIRVNDDHIGTLIAVQGIVRKATDVRPKITEAAFECQRCGTMSYIPQGDGGFQEPHECQGCERQGPFRIEFDQSNFVDSQKLRVQESPEGLRGGETPQSIDINLADDVTGKVTAGDHVTVVGILHIEQQTSGNEKTPVFDYYMEGIALSIEDEEFEDMEITDDDVAEIVELSNEPDIYEKMVDSVAPAIYGYEQEKLAMILQLFSGVTKHLPDGSRIRGDLHMLLIGDPGTGKCVTGDTRVTLTDGRDVPIRELVESNLDDPKPIDDGVWDSANFEVPSLAPDGTLTSRQATKVWKREAPDHLLRIRTNTGRELTATPSHPLFIRDGGMTTAVRADELTEGEFVAAPSSLPTTGTDDIKVDFRRSKSYNAVRLDLPDEWTPWLARLVGYIVAEGYVEQRDDATGFVSVTNNDREVLDDVADAFDRLGLNFFERSPHDGKSAREVICGSGEFVSFLANLSPSLLAGSDSQRIPEAVMSASSETGRAFVRAFIEGEGHVSATQREITVASMSRGLLEDVRTLLLASGISSQLRPRNNGSYRLRISGDDFEKYVAKVGFVTERKSVACEEYAAVESNTNTDVVPAGGELRDLREALGLTQADCGLPRSTYQHYERGDRNPSRESLSCVVSSFEDAIRTTDGVDSHALADGGTSVTDRVSELRSLVDGDIGWERIDSIERVEPTEEWVYDLEVEGTHSYVSNGLVSHNSQMLSYIRHIAPRSVYTSGKGSSSAGLCVTGDTRIHTEDGFREIETVALDEHPKPVSEETSAGKQVGIQTFDRNAGEMTERQSSHVWRMPKKPCRRIETAHGKTLTASENTPVLTCGKQGIEWVDISDIEPGQFVAVPKYGELERSEVPVRDFLELTTEKVKLSEESIELVRDELCGRFGHLRAAAAALDLSEDFVYDSLRNRHIPLSKLDRMLDAVELTRDAIDFDRVMIRHGDSITVPETFDEDLMYLLGLVFGDGDISLDRRGGNRGLVRISNSDEALLERAKAIFADKFDKHPEIERQSERVPCIRVSSATIARLFANAGMETPKVDLELAPELTTAAHADAFLRGLMDADGSVSVRENGGSSILISTISEPLAEQVQLMLETYGIRARRRERDRRGTSELANGHTIESKHVQHFLEMYGSNIERYADEIGFDVEAKQQALDKITNAARRREETIPVGSALVATDGAGGAYHTNVSRGDNPGRGRAKEILENVDLGDAESAIREAVDADLRWDRVIDSAAVGEREVFDLTVPETHNFVGNGIVTHNTAAAVRDDFGDGQQWTLEAGALVLADKGIAAVDELDKMRCVTGDSLVHLADGGIRRIRDLAHDAARTGSIEELPNGRTIRNVDAEAWTMAEDGTLVTRPVTAIHEYDAPDELTQVTLESGEQLTSTPDHPFFVFEEGERVERPAEDLVAGDQVYVPDSDSFVASDGGTKTIQSEPSTDDPLTTSLASVESVERSAVSADAETRVYDLTVEGTHNFVANGMIVHNSEDRSAMHEGLEQQQISVSKAGINATLKSRCSLLGAANPKYGRFDQYEPIGEQIDLEPALISRFDLIFTVTDDPDPDTDAELAEHIIKTNYAGELNTQRTNVANSEFTEEQVNSVTDEVAPDIDAELLRKYIAYSKRTCYPTLTEEAKNIIRDFYVDFRARGADEDAPVPVTARKLEALVRLSEASARVRLSDKVTAEDAERVTGIVESCLRDIGMDPETGEFDADIVETGRSKTQRDRIKNLLELIRNMQEEYEEGAPHEEVVERANAELNMDEKTVGDQLEKLKMKGDIYEPRGDVYRAT
ncbi:LAGLIDADG family homing endonuclease [Haloferax sp. S1W]|uniref:LAGLIDADG family homing endonuclease n=1 Tax=Haloferax sp. S1W TaxID=3377110 RepID=UPI0037CC4101